MLERALKFVTYVLLLVSLTGCWQVEEEAYTSASGQQVKLSDYKNSWLFIIYWASWCDSCKKEISELKKLALQQKNVRVLGVNFDGLDAAKVQELSKKLDISFDSLLTSPAKELGIKIQGIPTTLVLNPHSKLKHVIKGYKSHQKLAKIAQAKY